MYSYPIHCRNQRTAAQVRTPRPSPSAIRQRIARDLRVAVKWTPCPGQFSL